jgi:hypothetical protein
MLVVHAGLGVAAVLAHDPVVAAVVGDLEDVVGHGVIADFPGASIARREAVAIVDHPAPYGVMWRQAVVAADVAQRTAAR